ncbi:MAG: secretin N-terminal domain-containing protein [Pseudomonas sp.]|nr:secretin N-terminal domain-containing protein [Pseudomonas sp.]
MTALTRFFTLLMLACSCNLAWAASEVIQLNFRLAEDMLPIANSILSPGGRATAYGNQLVVNASADKIAELRAVLAKIDTQPRRLLISVDTQGNQNNNQRGYRADGTISGRHGDIVIGQGEQQGRNQVRIINRNTHSRDGSLQTVQTLEGSAALVQIGQSIPLRSTQRGPYGQIQEHTEYRSVNQGFYVTATLVGDTVQIDINSQNDRRSREYKDVIDTQNTSSRVTGRIGEWINVSGSQQDSNYRQDGFTQKSYSTGRENNQLQIKVNVLD